MKELFLLLALTFSPNAQMWPQEEYKTLWAKAEAAIAEGKPQTAAGYLTELEKIAEKNGDILEQYRIMRTKYECLSKYNWKEANKYYPAYSALQRKLFDNLDRYIEEYVNHPAVDALIYEKTSRMKSEADNVRNRSGQRYREVRKACLKAAEVFPKSEYRKQWLAMVEGMDSKSIGISSKKSFIYPGETLEFELSARNIKESEFAVYRLNDRYQITGGELLKQLPSHGRLVSRQRITDYKGDYNIHETITTRYGFAVGGIYVVVNSAGDKSEYELIYVSRVALATRQVDGSNEVYVADAKTGKPYGNATIYAWSDLYEDDKAVEEGFVTPGYISQKAYQLSGFTPLSQNIFSKKRYSAQIAAEAGGDKWSPAVNISRPESNQLRSRSNETVHYIYTDRTLYRAGDTVHFKLIALTTDYEKGKVLADKKITVSLYAPSSDRATSVLTLTTNPMGSVAGSFVIPASGKNGVWHLDSERGGASFNVEAYKDPKYKIELEKVSEIYKCGDAVVQAGRVTGYTSEGVADARVEYTVEVMAYYWSSKNRIIAQGETVTDASGRFEVPFTTEMPSAPEAKVALHRITVKSVAPGGETCESSKVLSAAREALSFNPVFDNEYRMDTLLLVNKAKVRTLTIGAVNGDGVDQPVEGWYKLVLKGRVRSEGKFRFGETIQTAFASLPSGEYSLEYGAETSAGGQGGKSSVVLLSADDSACPVDREMFFYPVEEKDAIDFMVGTSADDLFLELEVFDGGKVVYRKPLRLRNGAQHIKLDYKAAWKDQVTVSLYGIKDMKVIQNRHNFGREVPSNNFEIKVGCLRDRTTPNTTETFTVEAPQSEMLISIYDVTCDRYRKNNFYFSPVYQYHSSAPEIWGNVGGWGPVYRTRGLMMYKSAARADGMVAAAPMAMNDMAVEEESAMDFGAAKADEEAVPGPGEIDVRDDFSQTLAFIPQLEIPAGGKSTVTFTTREGLSAFRIAMLAHTKDLRSGTAERQIVVNKAVKIESFVPLFAIEGDRLVIKANVANTGVEKVGGRAALRLTAEDDKPLDIVAKEIDMTLEPGTSRTAAWEIRIPEGVKEIGVTTVFTSPKASDAEKRLIEVKPAARHITEAESFVVGSGRDKESCISELKARFNYPDAEIRYEEYSTRDALKEVLTKPETPRGDNMIMWLDALYVNQMRGVLLGADSVDVNLTRKAAARLGSLQKGDGGFSWFPCCSSSDLLTLMFLDKTYYMREVDALPRGTTVNRQIEKALGYVDKRILDISGAKKWNWRDLTYLFAARMEHPEYAMGKEIQGVLQEYLKRCRSEWQDIPIVEKAKLCVVLRGAGEDRQLTVVMNSLRDYAVRNDNVGCYFPNAVMPFRGMLHTEIYAHSILATVFAETAQMDMAKDIMKWLLLQKHNQEWKSNMASADAIFVLLKYRAPDVRFGAVYYTYLAPMLDVRESSNQLGVKRTYWRDGKQLQDGQALRVGDKVEVRYDIDNTENRSFVVMEASRPACFYPKDERSWGTGWFYCERREDRTVYYFQTLAEEDTSLSETFYVTQEGTFNSALVTIESLYAPEYRGHTGASLIETVQ